MGEKSINGLKYAVIFLSGIVIMLVGYLVYDKVFKVDIVVNDSKLLDLNIYNKYINYDNTYPTMKTVSFTSEEGRIFDINMGIDGSVYVGMYKSRIDIENVDKVIDIVGFESNSGLIEDSRCYMLNEYGEVYVYNMSYAINGIYEATLLDDVKNVDKLMKLNYAKKENAIGLWVLVAVLEDGSIIEIDSDNG